MSWLPDEFDHPRREELTTGHHLRPMDERDTEIDYPAVMGSRERLWARYGEGWGWPPATMTYEADYQDLARHGREIAAHESFLYGVFDEGETALFGCIYVDPPPEDSDHDAQVSWWVVDEAVGTELERALDAFVPGWIAETWGLSRVDYSP